MTTEEEAHTHNSGLAKVAVQCFADTFPDKKSGQVVVNGSSVFQIKFSR